MQATRELHSEPIPGYRLLEPLGEGGFGEVWKCEAPGGLHKAIKFVHGHRHHIGEDSDRADQELGALQHIKTIRHPFLLSVERVEVIQDDLLIVMELADRSLHDLFQDRRASGHLGIPRKELIHYLAEAAEVLDMMNQEHGLQHLDIKPQNLFLVGRHIKVADFGLVSSLADFHNTGKSSVSHGAVTPLYAAPEVFFGRFTLFSDQYSLAITYHELLTGAFPFSGNNYRQLALKHVREKPNLHLLPEMDRTVIARALAKEPRQRFASCLDFVRALEKVSPDLIPAPQADPTLMESRVAVAVNTDAASLTERRQTHAEVLQSASNPDYSSFKEAPQDNQIQAYRFLECLGRSSGIEVWRAQDHVGFRKMVKILAGVDAPRLVSEGRPWHRLPALRHPSLLQAEVVPAGPGRLAIITDPAEETMVERLRECMRQGHTGIPRPELLGYLRDVASILDDLREKEKLQHLSLCPRQVVLGSQGLRLLDFGFVELVWLPVGHSPASLSPKYSAPELFQGQITRSADVYSLAMMFVELLTGIHPFRNLSPRQLGNPELRGKPDLSLLTATDRPVIRRGLHPDPQRRFSTCGELINALQTSSEEAFAEMPLATMSPFPSAQIPRRVSALVRSVSDVKVARQLAMLLESLTKGGEMRASGELQYRLRGLGAGKHQGPPTIEHRCRARLVPGTAQLKLHGFCEQWNSQLLAHRESELPGGRGLEEYFFYEIPLEGTSWWQRLLGRTPRLQVTVNLSYPRMASAGSATPIVVSIQADRCNRRKAEELLEQLGPEVLRSVRNYLQIHAAGSQERLPYDKDVQLVAKTDGGFLGEPTPAHGREIWREGMSLILPAAPTAFEIYIRLPFPMGGSFLIPGVIQKTQQTAGGLHEAEVSFLIDAK